jgi:hypothetical protein
VTAGFTTGLVTACFGFVSGAPARAERAPVRAGAVTVGAGAATAGAATVGAGAGVMIVVAGAVLACAGLAATGCAGADGPMLTVPLCCGPYAMLVAGSTCPDAGGTDEDGRDGTDEDGRDRTDKDGRDGTDEDGRDGTDEDAGTTRPYRAAQLSTAGGYQPTLLYESSALCRPPGVPLAAPLAQSIFAAL